MECDLQRILNHSPKHARDLRNMWESIDPDDLSMIAYKTGRKAYNFNFFMDMPNPCPRGTQEFDEWAVALERGIRAQEEQNDRLWRFKEKYRDEIRAANEPRRAEAQERLNAAIERYR